MTNDEKNRAIAEWLEPHEMLPPPREPVIMDNQLVSLRGAWVCEMGYETGDIPTWYPRDFYRDEAANALVLEKLPEVGLHRDGEKWAIGLVWNQTGWKRYADRKTAICEAALAFIGSRRERGWSGE